MTELEIYKKAFELACKELEYLERHMYMFAGATADTFKEELLKSAKEQLKGVKQ